MPGADMPFPGEGEEILQEIRITSEQVIEKLEQTSAAEKKQTTRQTARLAAQTKVWNWKQRKRFLLNTWATVRLVQGIGSSLSHHGINQVHAARQQIKPTGPASPGLYVSSTTTTSSFKGEKLLCGKLPPYSTDQMGKREQRAVQGWRTVERRPSREKRKIKTLLTNIHLWSKAVQNIIESEAAKWPEMSTAVKEGPDTEEIWLYGMSYLKHPSRLNSPAQL